MSFTFNWPRFSDQFHFDAIQMLNTALNKGNKPPIIADRIEVVELEMGTQPPELEIRDIGDLTVDQFRGIFRLTYSGDAHLVLKTKVQANPLNHKQPDIHLMAGSNGMLAAKQPLVVPMLLRLSHFKLNSYVVLVVSKQKGITLVFKTDPLQNVDINSTFDSIAVIQKFIQREIEGQLRQMFREDLPGIIHRLSQQWVKAKVEAPYLHKNPPPPVNKQQAFETHSTAGASFRSMPPSPHIGVPPVIPRRPQSATSMRAYSYPRRPRSASGYSSTSVPKPRSPKPTLPPTPSEPVSFPDLENFDPTYGLRPEGIPTKSVFRGFSNLFTPNKGLADLTEDSEEDEEFDDDDDGAASFDIINWNYTVPDSNTSVYVDAAESVTRESGYETIPAVGGGTITRPRIYHSQSMIQPSLSPDNAIASSSKHRHPLHSYGSMIPPRSGFTTPGLVSQRSSGMYNPYFGGISSAHSVTGGFPTAPPFGSTPGRPVTPDSLETQPSRSSSGRGFSISTPPTEYPEHDDDYYDPNQNTLRDSIASIPHPPPAPTTAPSSRRPSVSSGSNLDHAFPSTSPNTPSDDPSSDHASHNPKIILRNNSIHQLSTLSHSNHTLSPYTRNLQHFTVRSVPPRSAAPSGLSSFLERQPTKAKRKRTFRLGGAKTNAVAEPETVKSKTKPRRTAPGGPEFDASDMDQYFRSHDDQEPSLAAPPSVAMASGVGGQPSPMYPQPSSRPLHPHRLHNASSNLRNDYLWPTSTLPA
ncbi:hypothetical protein FPV67DRAFT_1472512 [Lyophyllum atratum]|nr:hypothetical protein FPV67DRAFT_1472512 [Lyophyllum atratum]